MVEEGLLGVLHQMQLPILKLQGPGMQQGQRQTVPLEHFAPGQKTGLPLLVVVQEHHRQTQTKALLPQLQQLRWEQQLREGTQAWAQPLELPLSQLPALEWLQKDPTRLAGP